MRVRVRLSIDKQQCAGFRGAEPDVPARSAAARLCASAAIVAAAALALAVATDTRLALAAEIAASIAASSERPHAPYSKGVQTVVAPFS